MAFCDYARGDAVLGATTVSNMFIMEFLPAAPADYVKVYLFGLMLCAQPEVCDSLEKMSETLHLDIETVKNAFAYWQREGAVVKLSDNPPSYSFVKLMPTRDEKGEVESVVYQNRSYIHALQNLMPSVAIENHEIAIANDWLDVLGLSKEAVFYMVKAEVGRRGKLPSARTLFRHLNETALKWAEAGITDEASARAFAERDSRSYKAAQAVVNRFNQRRAPTEDEVNLVRKWLEQMKLNEEEILAACEETTKGERPSFKYLDSVLESKRHNPDEGELREKVKTLSGHLGISGIPTPDQIGQVKEFLGIGFEFAAIEQAAVQCGQNNRRRYEDIAKKLAQWRAAGVYTVEDIEKERKERRHYADIVSRVFEYAGIGGKISEADIKSARVWTALVDEDALYYASELAHGTEAPLKYIDKIIKNWSAKGITTLEKAKAEQPPVKAGTAANNPSQIMEKRDLKDEDFADWFKIEIKNG